MPFEMTWLSESVLSFTSEAAAPLLIGVARRRLKARLS